MAEMDQQRRSCSAKRVPAAAVRLTARMACLVLLHATIDARAADEPWPAFRNHNPFLQIFGLPAFEAAPSAAIGETKYDIALDVANHADSGSTGTEAATLDGESHFLTLALRHRIATRLVLGIDIPFVSHSGGILDGPIENWHDIWGLSNSQRRGPRDQLAIRYENPGLTTYTLNTSSKGLGDIRLNASLLSSNPRNRTSRQFGVRAGVKLPSGDAEQLTGSGAVDYSLGLYVSDPGFISRIDLDLSATVGVLFLGQGDVLPEIQRETVAFGGFAAAWHPTNRLDVALALYAQSAYYDSELDEIGGNSVQVSVGALYELPWSGMSLSVSLIEDLFDNATTDFAFQVAVRGTLHRRGRLQ